MVENIFTFCILALSTGGALAGEVCEGNIYTSNFYEYSVYCDNGCCGSYYSLQCCPSYVGLIVGAVTGGLCFIGGIVFLICLCHHCNKKKTSVGTVISNQPAGVNTTVVGTTQQGVYYQQGVAQQPVAYPPPGPNQTPMAAYPPPGPNQTPMIAFQAPPPAYPAPPPAYPAPPQAYPAPPQAYPPPAAGQSNPSSLDQQYPEKH